MKKENNNNVYILYSGQDERVKKVVDKIKLFLNTSLKIDAFDYQDKERLKNDKEDERHHRISTLLEAIKEGRVIIIHLDKHYLESMYCLDEIYNIAKEGDVKERVICIVHDDNLFENIFSKSGHEIFLKIVNETIDCYKDKEELTSPEKRILDAYPALIEDFFLTLKDLRYKAKKCDEYESIKTEIEEDIKLATKSLRRYLFWKKIKKIVLMIVISICILFSMCYLILIKNSTDEGIKITQDINESITIIDYKLDTIINNQVNSIPKNEDLINPLDPTYGKDFIEAIDLDSFSKELKVELKIAENLSKLKEYDKAKKIYKNLLKYKTVLTNSNRGEIYKQLVFIDYEQKKWDDAANSNNLYIGFLESLNDNFILKKADAYRMAGKIYNEQKEYKQARNFLKISEEMYQSYYKKPHEDILRNDLDIAYSYEGEKKYKEEVEILNKSLKFGLNLYKTNSIERKTNIPWIYAHLAYAQSGLDDINESIKNYQKAIEWYDQLDDNDTGSYDADKAWIAGSLGYSYENKKDYMDALSSYKKALRLYKKFDDIDNIATGYTRMGYTNFKAGKAYYPKAEEAFRDALNLYKKSYRKTPTDDIAIKIGHTYHGLAWFYESADPNNSDKIIENYNKAIETKKRLEPKKYLIEVAWSQRGLANYYFNKKDYISAEDAYKDALENCKKVVNEFDQTQYAKELALTYYGVGASIVKQGNRGDQATLFFENSLKIYEKHEISTGEEYRNTLYALQEIYAEEFNYTRGEAIAKKLLNYYEKIDSNSTFEKARQLLAIAYCKSEQDIDDDAKYYFDRSYEMLHKLGKNDKNAFNLMPHLLAQKMIMYYRNGDKNKLKMTLNELEQYATSAEHIKYIQFLKTAMQEKKFDVEALQQAFEDIESDKFFYIIDLQASILELFEKARKFQVSGDVDAAITALKQSFKLSMKGFSKNPQVYNGFLVAALEIMIELDINRDWESEINNALEVFKKNKDLINAQDMAELKMIKVKYMHSRLIFNDEYYALLQDALKIFKKNNKNRHNIVNIYRAYYYLGKYYFANGDKDKAEEQYRIIKKILDNDEMYYSIIAANNMLVYIYQDQEMYSLAIKLHLESIALLQKNKSKMKSDDYEYKMTSTYNELLALYILNNDIEMFNKKYEELEKISRNIIIKFPEELIMRTNDFIEVFTERKNYVEAIKFGKKIIQKYRKSDLEDLQNAIPTLYETLGGLYSNLNDIENSKKMYLLSIDEYEKLVEREHFIWKCDREYYKTKVDDLKKCVMYDKCYVLEYEIREDDNGKCMVTRLVNTTEVTAEETNAKKDASNNSSF